MKTVADYPHLVEIWHPTKNGNLKPEDISYGSNKVIWWFQPHDDPETGKHFDFEWPCMVKLMVKAKTPCPFIAGRKVWPGFNDIASLYPELAKEWHPSRNGDRTPENTLSGAKVEIWWIRVEYDEESGETREIIWKERLLNRISKIGHRVREGLETTNRFKSLAAKNPELAQEWHPTKNGDLTPDRVHTGDKVPVWWMKPYDDPETGRHFLFEWQDSVFSRVYKKRGCPFLSNRKVWSGFNDLATRYPEVAKEWHPLKNGDLKPNEVTAVTTQEVWWLKPYDDPVTGEHFDLEWPARVNTRTTKKAGCPYLAGQKVLTGFNDLAKRYPEIAKEWHPTKNGDLRPENVYAHSTKKVWWQTTIIDELTGKERTIEWKQAVAKRTVCNQGHKRAERETVSGVNTLDITHPELVKEWSDKNHLAPNMVKADSNEIVVWTIQHHDEKTGRDFLFEWKDKICNRALKSAPCPYLTGRMVMLGFNDLATTHPELAAQWHPTRNGDLTPHDITAHYSGSVWWIYPYDDPRTGHHIFVWPSTVHNRTMNDAGCPFLAGKLWTGFNDLKSLAPDLVAEWHPVKNGSLTPDKILATSPDKVWWLFPYDDPETGKHFLFEWQASPYARSVMGYGCPYLTGKMVHPGFNDLATKNPELVREWHPTKNGDLTPQDVTPGSNRSVWWILPYDDPETGKHHVFEWPATVYERAILGRGCPYLANAHASIWPGYNDLATTHPELAAEWHPSKNGNLTPQDVLSWYDYPVWWLYPFDDPETGKHFDFEWVETVKYRAHSEYPGCPFIYGTQVWPGYNDLATTHPDIAKEWDTEKNRTNKVNRVSASSKDGAWWICPEGHSWYMSISYRCRTGCICPYCRKQRERNGIFIT